MRMLVWIAEGTWPTTVDAARDVLATAGGPHQVRLVAAVDADARASAQAAVGGLMGRGRRPGGHDDAYARLTLEAAEELLRQALGRLGHVDGVETSTRVLTGRVEREVTAACEGMDYAVIGRDGDLSRLGPHSLGKHTRFVVDHAPCRVLLVWPEAAPGLGSIPPPPRPGEEPPPPPHEGRGGPTTARDDRRRRESTR